MVAKQAKKQQHVMQCCLPQQGDGASEERSNWVNACNQTGGYCCDSTWQLLIANQFLIGSQHTHAEFLQSPHEVPRVW